MRHQKLIWIHFGPVMVGEIYKTYRRDMWDNKILKNFWNGTAYKYRFQPVPLDDDNSTISRTTPSTVADTYEGKKSMPLWFPLLVVTLSFVIVVILIILIAMLGLSGDKRGREERKETKRETED